MLRFLSFRHLLLSAAVSGLTFIQFPAYAAEQEHVQLPHYDWSFSGPFGTYDRAALQRGYQVYKEVCSTCHSLHQLAYRNLSALGYSEAQVKTLAAQNEIQAGPNDAGEMFMRPALPSDRFKSPFANEQAARAANNGALPPDLSLITKARKGGADYVHALLTGDEHAPAGFALTPGMNYNKWFPGHQIAMPAPLAEGGVSYGDGTKASIDQMASDVATFLTWAAEPEAEVRKRMGIKVILFLIVFSGLLYASKRRLWAKLH